MEKYFTKLRRLIKNLINVDSATDVESTIHNIERNISIKGSTFLILICSSLLASIGLDTNSSAVIIGAMLISPLMSPILGIGLAVGINNRDLLIESLKNFGTAILISLFTSTIYFLLTPLGEPTNEIIVRTSPTLLDVGVAIFGGIAGIIAGSRNEKVTILPGVAIATALMPPLCTSGFGLATGRITFFLGAFYLFFINAVFISLATYVIVRILDFPYTIFIDRVTKIRVQRWIVIFSFLVIVPSIIILYNVVSNLRLKKDIEQTIFQTIQNKDRKIINWDFYKSERGNFVKAYVIGKPLAENKSKLLDSILAVKGFKLEIVQMSLTEQERKQFEEKTKTSLEKAFEINQAIIYSYKQQIDSLKKDHFISLSDTAYQKTLVEEIKILFPELKDIYIGKFFNTDTNDLFIAVKYNQHISNRDKNIINKKIEKLFRQKFKGKSFHIAQIEK